MCDGPVFCELLRRDVLAEADAREGRPAAYIAPGCAVHAVAAGHGNDEDADARHGKASVVGYDGPCRHLDALHNDVVSEIEITLGEIHLKNGAADCDAARGARRSVSARRIPLSLRGRNRSRYRKRAQYPESGASAQMGDHAACKTPATAIL